MMPSCLETIIIESFHTIFAYANLDEFVNYLKDWGSPTLQKMILHGGDLGGTHDMWRSISVRCPNLETVEIRGRSLLEYTELSLTRNKKRKCVIQKEESNGDLIMGNCTKVEVPTSNSRSARSQKAGKEYEIRILKLLKTMRLRNMYGKWVNTQDRSTQGNEPFNDIQCNLEGEEDIGIEVKYLKSGRSKWLQFSQKVIEYNEEERKWVVGKGTTHGIAVKKVFETYFNLPCVQKHFQDKLRSEHWEDPFFSFSGEISPQGVEKIQAKFPGLTFKLNDNGKLYPSTSEVWGSIHWAMNYGGKGMYKEFYVPIEEGDMIRDMYMAKECQYIQIHHKGLFYLGDRDEYNLGANPFPSRDILGQYLKVRVKVSYRNREISSMCTNIELAVPFDDISPSARTLDDKTNPPLAFHYFYHIMDEPSTDLEVTFEAYKRVYNDIIYALHSGAFNDSIQELLDKKKRPKVSGSNDAITKMEVDVQNLQYSILNSFSPEDLMALMNTSDQDRCKIDDMILSKFPTSKHVGTLRDMILCGSKTSTETS